MSKHRVKNREKKMRERIKKSMSRENLYKEVEKLQKQIEELQRKNRSLSYTIRCFHDYAKRRGLGNDVGKMIDFANEEVIPEKIFVADADFREITLD